MIKTCSVCKSNNTRVDWGHMGTFVSYYTLVCLDCGHKQEYRTCDNSID